MERIQHEPACGFVGHASWQHNLWWQCLWNTTNKTLWNSKVISTKNPLLWEATSSHLVGFVPILDPLQEDAELGSASSVGQRLDPMTQEHFQVPCLPACASWASLWETSPSAWSTNLLEKIGWDEVFMSILVDVLRLVEDSLLPTYSYLEKGTTTHSCALAAAVICHHGLMEYFFGGALSPEQAI